MPNSVHVVLPQYAICSDLTFPQLLTAAKKCQQDDEGLLVVKCDEAVSNICEYVNWLGGKQASTISQKSICGECIRFVDKSVKRFEHQEIRLSDLLVEDQARKILGKVVENPNLDNVEDFLKQEVVYNDIIMSSFATEYKLSSDFSLKALSKEQFNALVNILRSAVILHLSFRSFFQKSTVKSVHMWNGRFIVQRAFLLAARESRVPCFVYERGPNALPILMLNESATYQWSALIDSMNSRRFPFDFKEAFSRRYNFLLNKALGFTYYAFTDFPDKAHLDKVMKRAASRRIVSCFSSSDYEFLDYQGVSYDRTGALFSTQQEFILWICSLVKAHKDNFFVIRIHPNEGKRSLSKKVAISDFGARIIDQIEKLGVDNVEIIGPDDPLSSYSLLSVTALSITYASSIGIEAAQLGVPSLVVGDAFYRNTGAAHLPRSLADAEDYILGKKTFTRLELLNHAARSWIIDASSAVFGVWYKSGLKVRAYERGLLPVYDSRLITEDFMEYRPKAIVDDLRTRGQRELKPELQQSNDFAWIKELPTYVTESDPDLLKIADFLKQFWGGALGFPYLEYSVQRKAWSAHSRTPDGSSMLSVNFVRPPTGLKRKILSLMDSAVTYVRYPETRPFIIANVRISLRLAIKRVKRSASFRGGQPEILKA